MKNTIIKINYAKLVLASLVVGLLASLISGLLKKITEICQEYVFKEGSRIPFLYIILPSIGITLIYYCRKYLFEKRQNKGIREIYTTLENRKDHLPLFKIPSHFINGFLTVVFGGSTGIEVSTVVASATVGAAAHKKKITANSYKKELICAGVSAGVTTLFASPLVGLVFAIEVIARNINKTSIISSVVAALAAWGTLLFIGNGKLFNETITDWNLYALPYFIILSVITALLALYFTRTVIFIKERFALLQNSFIRVNFGAVLVGISILFFPQLFGDSYHALPELLLLTNNTEFSLKLVPILLTLTLLKPLVASLTLGAGGDGGVFAPSIVTGSMAGILVAIILNRYFDAQVFILNFAVIGAATMLSASIHAPFTAVSFACSIVTGGYIIFLPAFIACFIAKYTAQYFCPYTVYTYNGKISKKKIKIFSHLVNL